MSALLSIFSLCVIFVSSVDKWDKFFTERLFENQTLEWFNEPAQWGLNSGSGQLYVTPDPETDFWRKTFYDFTHYNGAVLEVKLASNLDWIMSTRVTVDPKNLYDLSGLFVRVSERTWVKSSSEFITDDEPNVQPGLQVGVVTTNEFSDWSTQNLMTSKYLTFDWRITKTNQDYLSEVRWGDDLDNQDWRSIRLSHLVEQTPFVYAGVVATCLSKKGGYTATFQFLKLTKPKK